MGPCTLQIGRRVVLVSHDGPPAAELAMFDGADIELAETASGGGLREAGYRTVAYEARRRLAVAGVTLALADEAAAAMRGHLTLAYARGAVVRRVARKLGASELFDGGVYDGALRRYEGAWLDLPLLANDAGLAGGTAVFQALGLIALLAEVSDDAPVVLSTSEHAPLARIGERTLRKHAFDGARTLPTALLRLAATSPVIAPVPPPGPSHDAIMARLHERLRATSIASVRDHLLGIERGLARRDPPAEGPLADPELWAIEAQLDDGDAIGVLDRLYTLEQVRGREPGTTYLRAKTALLLRQEPPRALAERVSALVICFKDFPELELLAAQAWVAAGDPRRGLPYARDLMHNAGVHPELRSLAEAIVKPKAPANVAPPATAARTTPRSHTREDDPAPTLDGNRAPESGSRQTDTDEPTARDPGRFADAKSARFAPEPPTAPESRSVRSAPESRGPAGSARSLTPPPAPIPSPSPGAAARIASPPPSGPKPLPPSSRRRGSSNPPRDPGEVRPSSWPASMPAPREEPYRPEHVDHTPASAPGSRRFMKGASMPPFQSEPPSKAAKAPIVPRVDVEEDELVETLTLPPRATDEMMRGAQMPQSPLEARVRCTLAARQLARHYRVERGLELRLGQEAVELMERQLLARFPACVLRDVDEAREAQLHGALLSEIIARTLGGEWVDVAPTEFGYWAMVVPTADGRGKRIWPFGRVLRFISSGGIEDLVGYYVKLRDMR